MVGIYKITSPSGKIYIGSSINIQYRTKYYKNLNCRGQVKLYNSLLRHGWLNHKFEIIEECSIEELYEKERYYGDLYNVLSSEGLNLVLPRLGDKKCGVAQSTKDKMSIAHSGSNNYFYGRKHTVETRNKLRLAQLGRKHTEDHKRKVSLNSAKSLSKLCINIETGIFYNSIKDAAIAHNQVHSSLKNRVNGHSLTYTPIRIA